MYSQQKNVNLLEPFSSRLGTANASQATTQMLQSTLEYERTEFEQIIDQKKKELLERDQVVSSN